MYAGKFNLNLWLRSFVRPDLVDDYERRCRDLVNEYAGRVTTNITMIELTQKLNNELTELINTALSQRKGVN